MPAPPWTAAPVASAPAPAYCALPATTPTTPRVYLSPSAPGFGSHRATSAASRTRRVGSGRYGCRPMSTRRTSPAAAAPPPLTRPVLSAPNVTVTSARTDASWTSPVSASTPEGRSTATTRTSAAARGAGPGVARCPDPARAPDAEQAVDDEVGAVEGVADGRPHPAAGASQRRESVGVGRVRLGQQCLDPHPAPGEPRPGEQARPRRCCPIRPAAAPAPRTGGAASLHTAPQARWPRAA